MDRVLGLDKPPGFPFNLNSAVDLLLKKEFDMHRAQGSRHPLMENYGVDALPFAHRMLDVWRENFKGVEALHKPTNLLITGAVDDLWQSSQGQIHVVDYKATSKDGEVSLDSEWQDGYKRQMEIYQWLLRRNNLDVSDTGYFVYCNGRRDLEAFDARIEFDVKVIPYVGNDSWIDGVLEQIKACLEGDLPTYTSSCDYCTYRKAAIELEGGEIKTAEVKLQTPKTVKKPTISSGSGTLF